MPEKYSPVACAVVDEATGEVLNVIMADPAADVIPKGCLLVPRPAEKPVDFRWALKAGVFEMRPEEAAKVEQAELADASAIDSEIVVDEIKP